MFSLKQSRGFTIIELLVAVGVTAILVALMLSITINILSGWNRSSGKLSNENQARLILDILSQDIQGAILRYDSNAWFVATIQDDQSGAGDSGMTTTTFTADWPSSGIKPQASSNSFVINPSERLISNYRFGQAGVWLRFFTVPPDGASTNLSDTSAPRAVAYQMLRAQVNGSAQSSYMLFRSEVRPGGTSSGSTFSHGYDLFQGRMVTDSDGSPGYNSTAHGNREDIASRSNATRVRSPHVDHVIGTNVIDFGIKIYGKEAGAEVELFPVRRNSAGASLGAVASAPPLTYAASLRNPASPPPDILRIGNAANIIYGDNPTVDGHSPIYPTAVEVLVRILTPEGARLIAALEANQIAAPDGLSPQAHWWRIAEQHSDVFTRRIDIRAKPL